MGVVNYYSVGGQLQGEQPVGGARVDYLTDALGSVTATVDQTGTIVNTYQYKPYGEKIEKRLARWRGVIQGAAEQSGRGVLPAVEWWGDAGVVAGRIADHESAFTLHESATAPFRHALQNLPPAAHRLLLIVGPEGGLADTEIATFAAAGAVPISLGPRILRTETAALVALAQAL